MESRPRSTFPWAALVACSGIFWLQRPHPAAGIGIWNIDTHPAELVSDQLMQSSFYLWYTRWKIWLPLLFLFWPSLECLVPITSHTDHLLDLQQNWSWDPSLPETLVCTASAILVMVLHITNNYYYYFSNWRQPSFSHSLFSCFVNCKHCYIYVYVTYYFVRVQ